MGFSALAFRNAGEVVLIASPVVNARLSFRITESPCSGVAEGPPETHAG